MKYRGEMRLIDSEETEKILLKAIEYFKVKCLPEKVGNYYSLLIKNSRSLEGQKKYEMERLDYEADISEPANKKTAIQKAKSSTFPITKNTADDIMRVCKARNS